MSRRAKRAAWLLAITTGAALAVYVAATLPPTEPRYSGKTLTYWLSSAHSRTPPPEERVAITNAITAIATNNLKLLITWFQEPDPAPTKPWLARLTDWAETKQHIVKLSRPKTERVHFAHAAMAWWVFSEFPDAARYAIPAFTNVLCEARDIEIKGKAATILDGTGLSALAAVSPLLSSPDATNRAVAAFIVGNRGADATPFIPQLQHLLADKSPYSRMASADALMKLHSDPAPLIPVLLQGFREGDETIKFYATDILGRATNCASSASTGLLQLFREATNQEDRLMIYTALQSLDKDAADQIRTNVFPWKAKAPRSPMQN